MTPATLTPRQRDFKAALEDARALSEDDLRRAVELLPPTIRDLLARGPAPHRWTCGVCDAFGADWYRETAFDLSDPLVVAWIYHEVPKADMTHRDQLHYGPLANQTYERTIATYRAAGWDGEAEEANA